MRDDNFKAAMHAARINAQDVITHWMNVGHCEFEGQSAGFGYQVASVVLAGLVASRHLETLPPEEAAVLAELAARQGFGAIRVPRGYVLLHSLTCARACVAAMDAETPEGGRPVVINRMMRDAASDVITLLGDETPPSIRKLAGMSDAELTHQGHLWEQVNTLAHGAVAGSA